MAAKRRANGEGNITKRKDGTYQASLSLGFKPDGKRNRVTVYGRSQREVREKLDQLKRQSAEGVDLQNSLTVAAYFERWLRHIEPRVRPNTSASYAWLSRRHILPRLGHVKLTKLTALQAQSMVTDVAVTVGACSANACRSLLKQALKQAVRWRILTHNVADAVDPYKREKQERRLWTPEESVRFLDHARAHRLYAAFYLALATGLRRGELLGLRWTDVEGATLVVRQQLILSQGQVAFGPPKSRSGVRRIDISESDREVLEAHRRLQSAEQQAARGAWQESGLVFTNELGAPLDPNNFGRTWRKLRAAAGVPPIRIHDLRHLHASLLIKSNFNPKEVSTRLGHTRASFTLDTYIHDFEAQRQARVVGLSELLGTKTLPSQPN